MYTIKWPLMTCCLVVFLLMGVRPGESSGFPGKGRPSTDAHVFDEVGLLSDKCGLEKHLRTLRESADIEMVVVILKGLEGENIDALAEGLMSDWKIGKKTHGLKGLLFLMALKERLVRFEVGYDIEAIYPDAFVGYIEQDQMAPFFELGRVADGISATLEMIIARAYEKIDEKVYALDDGVRGEAERHYSGGAGARRRMAIGSIKVPELIPYAGEIQAYFSPQPTPALALLRDIEKNRRHIRGYDFDLYTDETRAASRNWPCTRAQMDNQVRDTRGKHFKVYTRKNRAVAVFPPKNRNNAPFFFERCARGWQADIAAMSRLIHFDMRNRFHMTFTENPFLDLFRRDYTFDVHGYLYFRDRAPLYIGVKGWDGSTRSVKIQSLVPGGPAERVGLRPGDTILRIGKTRIKDTGDLRKVLRSHRVGDRTEVTFKRGLFKKTREFILEVFDPFAP